MLLSVPMQGAAVRVASAPVRQGTASEGMPAQYRFAGIPWGASADLVTTTLEKLGLSRFRTDSSGEMVFHGKIIYRDALVVASMINGGLGRIAVSFAEAPGMALPLYEDVRRDLIGKYGKPTAVAEQFLEPYRRGDGHEDEAFKTGKAHFAATWHPDPSGESLSLLIDERPGVLMLYTSPEWPAEAARRRAQ